MAVWGSRDDSFVMLINESTSSVSPGRGAGLAGVDPHNRCGGQHRSVFVCTTAGTIQINFLLMSQCHSSDGVVTTGPVMSLSPQ